MVGVIGLVGNVVVYGLLKYALPQVAFLDRMAICFVMDFILMGIVTLIKPLAQPVDIKINHSISLEPAKIARNLGLVVVALTLILYVVFW